MESKMEHEISAILAGASDMTIATIRPDGYPQATTVSYVTHGMTIYFGAAADSQKARNIAGCDKISLTVNLPYKTWDEIRGISLGGLEDLMLHKFPQVADYAAEGGAGISLFRISPDAISLLDYRKGFGHTEYVRNIT
jgi:hypothetical protein